MSKEKNIRVYNRKEVQYQCIYTRIDKTKKIKIVEFLHITIQLMHGKKSLS